MTVRLTPPTASRVSRSPRPLGVSSAALLGVAAALVVSSCGSGGKGLIPISNAGPLQSDFEAVAQAAQSGNGSCGKTAAAIRKTEQDFAALPTSVNAGLRTTLHQGIANLRTRALVLCTQPLPQATATSPPPSTTSTQPTTPTTTTTSTVTQTTSTQTTPTVTTPTTPEPTPPPGGGTPAPGAGGGESPSGAGSGQGGGGTGAGEGGTPGGGAGGGGDGSGSAGSGREGGK